MEELEKLDQKTSKCGLEKQKGSFKTKDFISENIAKISEIFPNVVTETTDVNGTVQKAIDFDALKQELSDNIVEGYKERYSRKPK
jgi:hypothetical protein